MSSTTSSSANTRITPFEINVTPEQIEDLKARLLGTRLPNIEAGGDGVSMDLYRALLEHWRDSYDWMTTQNALNAFKNFKTNVGGCNLHFIHERSRVPGAVPLLLLHGWPGSVWEFHRVIPSLVAPEGRALRVKQAFHVVCPSLPGFAWSEALPGMDAKRVAGLMNELMLRLGYEHYVVQGGDWGGAIAAFCANDHPENCVALHLNNMVLPMIAKRSALMNASLALTVATDLSPLGRFTLSERDRSVLTQSIEYARNDSGYMILQASKPNTIGAALSDTPAGLLAWIVEKIVEWSDGGGNILNALSKDELIAEVCIYWFTNCFASSARMYYETLATFRGRGESPTRSSPQPTTDVLRDGGLSFIHTPTGFASFPRDIIGVPRRWLAHSFNLQHYSVMSEGGHFAAWECPEAFVQDVRAFVFKSAPFEKCVKTAQNLALSKRVTASGEKSNPEALALRVLLLAPALPTPVVATAVAYLLSSKL